MTGVVVVPMASEQVGAVATVLARASHDDPIWAALWPKEDRRRQQLSRMFLPPHGAAVHTGALVMTQP